MTYDEGGRDFASQNNGLAIVLGAITIIALVLVGLVGFLYYDTQTELAETNDKVTLLENQLETQEILSANTNTNTNTSATVNTNTVVETAVVDSEDVVDFKDANELSLSFSYPESWSAVLTKSYQGNGDGVIDMHMINSDVLIGTVNNPATGSEGRGGSWVDKIRTIDSQDDVDNFCIGKTNCSIGVNSNGISYAKHYDMDSDEGGNVYSGYFYYMYNPSSDYSGVIFSAASMNYENTSPTVENEAQIAELVDTVKF